MWWLNMQALFLLWIPADDAYTEEEEWSDEFDDDTLGLSLFINTNDHLIIRNNKNVTLLEQKQPNENSEWKAFKREHSHNW